MTNILVFDDIIDLEYQEQIKSTLLGTKQYKNYLRCRGKKSSII